MFKIMSISAGWLMGEISDGRHTHFFDYSYLTDFIEGLDRVLSCYGLIGYRENWTYEFPLSLYLKLGGKHIHLSW